jgi:hypothetical protein
MILKLRKFSGARAGEGEGWELVPCRGIKAHALELPLQMGVPVILNLIVRAPRYSTSDQRPPDIHDHTCSQKFIHGHQGFFFFQFFDVMSLASIPRRIWHQMVTGQVG